MAHGSFYENKLWLRKTLRRELLTQEQTELLEPLVDRLGPLNNGYLRSIGWRQAPDPMDERTMTKDE
jgi:hypothetical protein